jgi:hypothetical protein
VAAKSLWLAVKTHYHPKTIANSQSGGSKYFCSLFEGVATVGAHSSLRPKAHVIGSALHLIS